MVDSAEPAADYQRREAPGRERYQSPSATVASATTAAATQNAPASSENACNHVTTPTTANAAETTSHEARSTNCSRVKRRVGCITSTQSSGNPPRV